MAIIDELEKENKANLGFREKLNEAKNGFSNERASLVCRIREAEVKIETGDAALLEKDSIIKRLREDLELTKELNKATLDDFEEENVDKSTFQSLNQRFEQLQQSLILRDDKIQELGYGKADLAQKIVSLEGRLTLEEEFKNNLRAEIEGLQKRNNELEERHAKARIENKGSTGLSKLDFMNSRLGVGSS